jgi:hypothetical protein
MIIETLPALSPKIRWRLFNTTFILKRKVFFFLLLSIFKPKESIESFTRAPLVAEGPV